ncbi:MAG: potassium channel family protein [Geminicoccaceae bacterium]
MTRTHRARAAAVTRRALSLRIFRLRFLFLLLALLLVMLVSPLLESTLLHRFYMVVMFSLVLVAAIMTASDGRRHQIVALTIGLPWMALNLYTLLWNIPAVATYANILACLFIVYVLLIVIDHILRADSVDLNILLGASSAYLLIALAWTTSYLIIFDLDPGAFSLVHGESRPYFHQFLYFSLTTMTTVGYGDITPLNPFAQIWATMEAVVGTLYMALLVARLVGLYQAGRPDGGGLRGLRWILAGVHEHLLSTMTPIASKPDLGIAGSTIRSQEGYFGALAATAASPAASAITDWLHLDRLGNLAQDRQRGGRAR